MKKLILVLLAFITLNSFGQSVYTDENYGSGIAFSLLPGTTVEYPNTITLRSSVSGEDSTKWVLVKGYGTITGNVYSPTIADDTIQVALVWYGKVGNYSDSAYSDTVTYVYGFEFETYELLGSLTTPLSDTAIFKVNRLIKMLKDSIAIDTLSEFFDRFFLLANETAESGVRDLCDSLTSRRCTAVNSPTFNTFEGFTFNGTSNYLNSNFNAYTQGINYTLNNCAIGVYSRTNVSFGLKALVGVKSITSIISMIPSYNGNTSLLLNTLSTCAVVVSNTTTNAYFLVTRNGSAYTNIVGYKNTTALTNVNGTSSTVGIPDYKFYVGARNNANTTENYWNGQISCIFFSEYVTAELNRKILNCIEYFMDSNGKGIVP